ncbi:uncharacterized protein LOC143029123 isoform X2 [Oratosquilla oratoria]
MENGLVVDGVAVSSVDKTDVDTGEGECVDDEKKEKENHGDGDDDDDDDKNRFRKLIESLPEKYIDGDIEQVCQAIPVTHSYTNVTTTGGVNNLNINTDIKIVIPPNTAPILIKPNPVQLSSSVPTLEVRNTSGECIENFFFPVKELKESNKEDTDAEISRNITKWRNILNHYLSKYAHTFFVPWLRDRNFKIEDFYTEPQLYNTHSPWQTVDIIEELEQEDEYPLQQTHILVEGEAGMGKTLLATKLALDWAAGKKLQRFTLVFLIFLKDFSGQLKEYLKDNYMVDKFEKMWEHCKEGKNVLFILDGYDELEKDKRDEIQLLLKKRIFPCCHVLITSRPDCEELRSERPRRLIFKGFSEHQVYEFIEKYFSITKDMESGRNLRKEIEKDHKYQILSQRPLFCVLLCMLYKKSDQGEGLPDRIAEVLFKITGCLINWREEKLGKTVHCCEDFPPTYKNVLLKFGKLCVEALKLRKSSFEDKELSKEIENKFILEELGFLYKTREGAITHEKVFWNPPHKIFIEYIACIYMAHHIGEKNCRNCQECRDFSKVLESVPDILKILVGILRENAYRVFDSQRYSFFIRMEDRTVLELLQEAGDTSKNKKKVAKLLDRSCASVTTTESDFDGWSKIMALNVMRKLKTLEIIFRIKSSNPEQESTFYEASPAVYKKFFEALRKNTTITKLRISTKQDGVDFTDDKIKTLFTHLKTGLLKRNLQHLEIVGMKMPISYHFRQAMEDAAHETAFKSLTYLKIDTFITDDDLIVLCDILSDYASRLETLHLQGLTMAKDGFMKLAHLLKNNQSLRELHISLNIELLMNTPFEEVSPDEMMKMHLGTGKEARRLSKEGFNRKTEGEAAKAQQTTEAPVVSRDYPNEFRVLLSDLQKNGVNARMNISSFFYISCGNSHRLPLPWCEGRNHGSLFHVLFASFVETQLTVLRLGQPFSYMKSLQDVMCLGYALRKAPNLEQVEIKELQNADLYLPIIMGIGLSSSIKKAVLSSDRVDMTDAHIQLASVVLAHNTSLRSLAVQCWKFNVKDPKTTGQCVFNMLRSWQVKDLDLKCCTTDIVKQSCVPWPWHCVMPDPNLSCTSITSLCLQEAVLTLSTFVHRGPLLLHFIRPFSNITSLNLSMTKKVDDNKAISFFTILGSLRRLQELIIRDWEFSFKNYEETCIAIGVAISKSCCQLRTLDMMGMQEHRKNRIPKPCHKTLIHNLYTNMKNLREFALCNYGIIQEDLRSGSSGLRGTSLNDALATKLGNCFREHWPNQFKFTLKFFCLSKEAEAALIKALGKVEVTSTYPLKLEVRR